MLPVSDYPFRPDMSQELSAREAAKTWQNRAAGAALRVARGGQRQEDFASALGGELGYSLSGQAVAGYETGNRGVPSAVLLAAAMLAGKSVDALFLEAELDVEPLQEWLAAVVNATSRDQLVSRAIDELQAQMDQVFGELGLAQPESRTRLPTEDADRRPRRQPRTSRG
jgi:transcriptional regulator with XRE-family HTH domain